MRQSQRFLEAIDNFFYRRYLQQLLVMAGVLLFSLANGVSYAAAPNPGAVCDSNFAQGSLTSSDYTNLASAVDTSNYVDIEGDAANRIPLKIKMSITEKNGQPSNNSSFSATTVDSTRVFKVFRNFPSMTSVTSIDLDFRNRNTNQPIFLTNVALSAFDIDYANRSGNIFDDYVLYTGVTESGATIDGTYRAVTGSRVRPHTDNRPNTPGTGLYLLGRTANCPINDLDTVCQGSIQFSQPVKSVKIRYSNANFRISGNPTNQEIHLRLDNYCYAPPASSYDISKDDGVSSIGTNNTTTYTIKVTNTGGNALQNIILKDPVVSGLSKQSNITCDTSDTANVCSTPPTVTQLERSTGFTIPTLAAGKSYSIKVPTLVTAASGTDVTNTATISHTTLADKSSSDTNSVTSIFDGGSFNTPATCPSGHKMYYIGANPPSFSPINSQLLNWTSGNTSRTFTFEESAGNKTFLISFSGIRNLNSNNGTPPYFGSINGVTTSAINMQHVSAAVETNHILDISINRTISKSGYKIQDLDSTIAAGQIPYIEQVDVSKSGGQLTFNDVFHTINSGRNIVTAIREKNCGVGECTIDATWGYNTANTPFNLKHNNSFTERRSPHTVGYSDFYFCLAPPQIIVNKLLDGSRVDGDDQFRIELLRTDNNAFVQAFTTTGSGDVVTDNTTTVTTLTEGVNYTVSEQIINGNLLDYQTTYTCSNATTGTDVVFSSGEMPVNNAGTRRTFAINNVGYGDEITCNITNTPVNNYTFTGFVFNDNGGIAKNNSTNLDTNTKSDISSTFTGNSNYFNGNFDSLNETGIGTTPSLSVSLTDCKGNNISTIATNINPQTELNNPLGQFKFTVPASAIANLAVKEVCLIQTEPDSWIFSVDTTPNIRRIDLTINPNRLDYKTDSTLNLDFGEVETDYTSLVLIKSQYVNNCDINANYSGTSFSTAGVTDIEPGKCIAYKIDAYNRGHVDLKDIQISDRLQTKAQGGSIDSVFAMPLPKGILPASYSGNALPSGTITSNIFNLNKPTGAIPTQATLYFNTKYGTTNSPNP